MNGSVLKEVAMSPSSDGDKITATITNVSIDLINV